MHFYWHCIHCPIFLKIEWRKGGEDGARWSDRWEKEKEKEMEDMKCHFGGKAMKMARAKIEAKKGGEQGVPSRMVWYYV